MTFLLTSDRQSRTLRIQTLQVAASTARAAAGAGGRLTPPAVAGRVSAHSDVRSRGTGPGHVFDRRAAGARRETTKEDDAMRRLSATLLLLLLSLAAVTPAVAA